MATAFRIAMDGAQEVPPRATSATGLGVVIFDDVAVTASYEITVTGLDFGPLFGSPAQTPSLLDDVEGIHVHNQARGVNGGIVFGQRNPTQDPDDFAFSFNVDGSTTFSGIWETTDPAGSSINNFAATLGAATVGSDVPLYWNIHTEQFAGGEIRGQWVCIATDNGETVNGTAGNDILPGLGGDDQVFGLGGNDRLDGGAENDTLDGGAGNDTLDGGAGNDTASYASAGAGVAVNLARVVAQNTIGAGIDTLAALENLTGSNFADMLFGNGNANVLQGGGGIDNLDGAGGDDQMFGGDGNDGFRGSTGFDHYDGGAGTGDTVNYMLASSTVIFLDGSGANDAAAEGDTFTGIENIAGSVTGPDFLTGDAAGNRLVGNGGNDRLTGRAGIDTLEGGAGTDRLVGEQGNDVLTGGADADTFVFNLAPAAGGLDRTNDFAAGIDKIEIDASAFGGGLVAGGAVQFVSGSNPTSAGFAGGVFLYDTDDGFLRFDADGQGAGAAVAFFRLQNLPALTAADFIVVA